MSWSWQIIVLFLSRESTGVGLSRACLAVNYFRETRAAPKSKSEGKYCCRLLILRSARVLARDRVSLNMTAHDHRNSRGEPPPHQLRIFLLPLCRAIGGQGLPGGGSWRIGRYRHGPAKDDPLWTLN